MAKKMLERILPNSRDQRIVQAKNDLWTYNQLMNPQFFRDDRPHLVELAHTLQGVFDGTLRAPDGSRCRRVAISEPPRMGKSYSLSMAEQWQLGRKKDTKIISVSYNETLSTRFSKGVRDNISATKVDPDFVVFSDIFPDAHIRDGDAAVQMWSLEGQYFNYLGAGFGGTITGVGCNLLVIDDPIKNHLEANNDRILDDQWAYYTDTLLSRVEEDGIIILIMTRWNTRDLVGRVLEQEPGKWHVLRHPACLDEKKKIMLCPSLLSYDSYMARKKLTSPEIMEANYQNNPIDAQGRLYSKFSEYEVIPTATEKKAVTMAYIDTADTGTNFLCALVGDRIDGEGYIKDILYTDEPMEVTEPAVAAMLYKNGVHECIIESNNGGRGFARKVEQILWEKYRTRKIKIIWHNQRQNKMARILTEATFVQDHLYFPPGWKERWPQYYNAMRNFQRKEKNAFDDAPDGTTGFAEVIQQGASRRTKFASGKGARRR